MVEGFSWALSEFEVPQIMAAIREFVLNSPEIPTPSEIRAIAMNMRTPEQVNAARAASLQSVRDEIDQRHREGQPVPAYLHDILTPDKRAWLEEYERKHNNQ